MDVKSQLYTLFCAILYKGLEHPRILVSVGGPGTNPPGYQGAVVKFWGSQKLYTDFLLHRGWRPWPLCCSRVSYNCWWDMVQNFKKKDKNCNNRVWKRASHPSHPTPPWVTIIWQHRTVIDVKEIDIFYFWRLKKKKCVLYLRFPLVKIKTSALQ